MGSTTGRERLLALHEKAFREHVIDKLHKHDSNFVECDTRYQDMAAKIEEISDRFTDALSTHSQESKDRHLELLSTMSGFISSAENLKKGASFFAWLSDIIKSGLKFAGNVALVVSAAIIFYLFVLQKINSDQLFVLMAKLSGVAK